MIWTNPAATAAPAAMTCRPATVRNPIQPREIGGRWLPAGVKITQVGRDEYSVAFSFPPTAEDGWARARALPAMTKQAIREYKALRVRCRRLHSAYPAKWRKP